MKLHLHRISKIFSDESGATAIEYSALVSGITITLLFAALEFTGKGGGGSTSSLEQAFSGS